MLYRGPGVALPCLCLPLPCLSFALPCLSLPFLCLSLALPCLPDSALPCLLSFLSLVTLPLDPALSLALEVWSDTSWWQQAGNVQMAVEAAEVMLDARGAGEGL